ncbi:glycogenin-1 isoform X2 [Pogoniulus pusillus]|uniref:glycogenin-1 isoform X2 n=1 Tax=Pogoniulus pusillus TaxID=488313 RepID=UPI0030B92AD0
MADQSFVTLATNDSYVKGALVLGSSLQQYRTTRKLTALITPQVSDPMRKVMEKVFDEVILVNVLDSGDSAHLALMKRPELGVTLTKLHCWELTQFSKCVFMDADTMVLSNIDELFEREELSAAPDPGWPDCFNSGVFVYRPSIETYNQLLQFATEKGSFDGADQGLLNTFFSSWATTDMSKHLPFIYNLSSTSVYSYLPAFKAFGANTKVVHFLGSTKPWNYTYDSRTKSIKGNMDDPKIVHPEFLNMWWDTYLAHVLPLLEQHGIAKESTGVNMESCTIPAHWQCLLLHMRNICFVVPFCGLLLTLAMQNISVFFTLPFLLGRGYRGSVPHININTTSITNCIFRRTQGAVGTGPS